MHNATKHVSDTMRMPIIIVPAAILSESLTYSAARADAGYAKKVMHMGKALTVIVVLAIILALVLVFSPRTPASPAITDARYVSFSQGDDAHDGTSPDRPWKTLTKVSQQRFGPGAIIYLRRGDTWNDALILTGKGNSAAHQWITVKPYGPETEANPTIDRSNAADANKDWAIKLVDGEGWRFENIAIKNSKTGLVYLGSDEKTQKKGLHISNLTFENIRGLPNHQKNPDEDKRPYWWLRGSTAISITGVGYCKDGLPATDEHCSGGKYFSIGSYGASLSDVTIEDVTIRNATYGIWVWGAGFTGVGKNYRIARPHVVRAGIGGIEMSFVENALVSDPKIEYVGGDTIWSGTFGIDVNYVQNVTIQGGEVAYTLGEVFYEGEGTGINLNGPNTVTIKGVQLHNNDGSAIAIQGATLPDRAVYEFSENRIWDNARKNDNPAPGQYEYPEFITIIHLNSSSAATIKNNMIKVKPNRHLIVIARDLVSPDIWKDEFSSDYRLPDYSFCDNRDSAQTNAPLIAGDKECGS